MAWRTLDSSLLLAGLGAFYVLLAFAVAGVHALCAPADRSSLPNSSSPQTPPLETW